MWTHILNDDGRKTYFEYCTFEIEGEEGQWTKTTGYVNILVSGNTFNPDTGERQERDWLPPIEIDPIPVYNRAFRNLKVEGLTINPEKCQGQYNIDYETDKVVKV